MKPANGLTGNMANYYLFPILWLLLHFSVPHSLFSLHSLGAASLAPLIPFKQLVLHIGGRLRDVTACGTGTACGTACGTGLDMLITYFSIVLICFLLQFFHRGLRIGLL